MRSFYTYMWLREDGTPYYVGKGTGTRAWRRGCPSPDRVILQEWPSEEEALQAEIFLIAFYGRKDIGTGILHNFTDGGQNGGNRRGKIVSATHGEALRKAWVARKARGEVHVFSVADQQKAVVASAKVRAEDPTWKQRLSKSERNSWTTERRAAQAERARAQILARSQARKLR